jgi:hypothetical protein
VGQLILLQRLMHWKSRTQRRQTLTRSHLKELFKIDLPIPVQIHHPYHLIDLFISDLFSQRVHNEPYFCCADVLFSVHVESGKSFADFVIGERLFVNDFVALGMFFYIG